MVIGAVLLLVGLIGFVSNPLVSPTGLFTVNTNQNILHLVGGALGLWFGMNKGAKAYNMWLGIVAAVVGVLGLPFVPQAPALLQQYFNITANITYLHLAIAAVSLGVAYGVKK